MKQIGLILVVVWLLFFKGCSTLQSYGPGVVTTIGHGAELALTPQPGVTAFQLPTTPAKRFSFPTPKPGAGAPVAAIPTPTPASATTAPPTPTAYCGTDGNLYRDGKLAPRNPIGGCGTNSGSSWDTNAAAPAVPTRDYVAEAQAARDASVPGGERHYVQTPGDTYFTVGESLVRYYVDGDGHVVDTRLPDVEPEQLADAPAGLPPEQKIFLDPNNAADAAYLAAQPTAAATRQTCTKGCGR